MLAEMGLAIPTEEIFNPPAALLHFFEKNPEKSAYLLVTEDVRQLFTHIKQPKETADFVVIGDVRGANLYERLNQAFRYLEEGAGLIALQESLRYYTVEGAHLDTGAFVQLLEYASKKERRLIGKPAPEFFHLALDLSLIHI